MTWSLSKCSFSIRNKDIVVLTSPTLECWLLRIAMDAYHHSSRPFFCSVISLSKLDNGSRLKRSSLDGLVAAKSPDCFFIACPTNILPPNNATICTWPTSNVRAARRNQRVHPVYMSTVIGYRFLGQPTYVAKLVTICSPQSRPVQVPIPCLGWGPLQSFRNRSRYIFLLRLRTRALYGSSIQVKSCPKKLRGQLRNLKRVCRPPRLIERK